MQQNIPAQQPKEQQQALKNDIEFIDKTNNFLGIAKICQKYALDMPQKFIREVLAEPEMQETITSLTESTFINIICKRFEADKNFLSMEEIVTFILGNLDNYFDGNPNTDNVMNQILWVPATKEYLRTGYFGSLPKQTRQDAYFVDHLPMDEWVKTKGEWTEKEGRKGVIYKNYTVKKFTALPSHAPLDFDTLPLTNLSELEDGNHAVAVKGLLLGIQPFAPTIWIDKKPTDGQTFPLVMSNKLTFSFFLKRNDNHFVRVKITPQKKEIGTNFHGGRVLMLPEKLNRGPLKLLQQYPINDLLHREDQIETQVDQLKTVLDGYSALVIGHGYLKTQEGKTIQETGLPVRNMTLTAYCIYLYERPPSLLAQYEPEFANWVESAETLFVDLAAAGQLTVENFHKYYSDDLFVLLSNHGVIFSRMGTQNVEEIILIGPDNTDEAFTLQTESLLPELQVYWKTLQPTTQAEADAQQAAQETQEGQKEESRIQEEENQKSLVAVEQLQEDDQLIREKKAQEEADDLWKSYPLEFRQWVVQTLEHKLRTLEGQFNNEIPQDELEPNFLDLLAHHNLIVYQPDHGNFGLVLDTQNNTWPLPFDDAVFLDDLHNYYNSGNNPFPDLSKDTQPQNNLLDHEKALFDRLTDLVEIAPNIAPEQLLKLLAVDGHQTTPERLKQLIELVNTGGNI